MTRPVAVVTGASRGIGRSTALAFARRGLDVAMLGRPSAAHVGVRRELEALSVVALEVACDVAVELEVKRAAATVLEKLGAPEVVVNNAGIVRRAGRIEETPAGTWDEVVAVNLRGPFLVSAAFLPAMRARGRGRLVHVASVSSTIGCPGNASYAASKWGLVGFSKSLAEELRGTGLASVAVLPGAVDTDMLAGSGFEPKMGPDEVADAIAYLGLDAPLSMNGAAIEMFG